MAQTDSLASRIDAQFSAAPERAKKFQSEQLEKCKGREVAADPGPARQKVLLRSEETRREFVEKNKVAAK